MTLTFTCRGETFEFSERTYERGICDMCGRRRMVDWWAAAEIGGITGFDVCRTCARD